MANLNNKHFGNKVFLMDLDERIVSQMLEIPNRDPKNKIPNFGILVRYKDGTVGITVRYIDENGYENYSQEPTNHTTIKQWADFHS